MGAGQALFRDLVRLTAKKSVVMNEYANMYRSKMTNSYEGSLIRLFRRLEELIRQMGQAVKVMGNEELVKKFDESLQKIRRDIVAAQSLYL